LERAPSPSRKDRGASPKTRTGPGRARLGGRAHSQQTSRRRAMQERQLLGRPPSQLIFKLQMWEVSLASSPKRSVPLREVPTPRSCARSVPWSRAASGVPTFERTSCLPVGLAFRVPKGCRKSCRVERRVAWAFCGPSLVSSTGDAGCSENVPGMSKCSLPEPRLRMLLAEDSRSVVMKVDIR